MIRPSTQNMTGSAHCAHSAHSTLLRSHYFCGARLYSNVPEIGKSIFKFIWGDGNASSVNLY